MNTFSSMGPNGYNLNAFGQASNNGLYGKVGSSVPVGINNSYLFANAEGNYQSGNNSQANFTRQFGASTNLGGLLGVKYTDSDRAKDLEISAISPLGMFSLNKTTGLQDAIKGTYQSGISPTVGASLTASVEKEKGQALRYMTQISLAPFEHTTLSTQLYGQGKNTGFSINLGYNRIF